MTMKTVTIALLLSSIYLSSCATATRGTQERVRIESDPIGATVTSDIKSQKTVTYANGTSAQYIGCAPTPCSLNISRKANPVLTIKKDGHQTLKVKIVSSWATGSRSVASGSLVAGLPPGSHAVAGSADALKRIPIQGAMFGTGLMTFGVAPLIDIAAGSNRSLSPNPVTVFLAPNESEIGETESP